MRKILYVTITLFAFLFLTGCDYEYKDEFQTAIDHFENTNFTLNVYGETVTTHTYMGEVVVSEIEEHHIIKREGRRELRVFNNELFKQEIYLEKHKKEIDQYIFEEDQWRFLSTISIDQSQTVFTMINPQEFCHDDFVCISENKWVPLTNKYDENIRMFLYNNYFIFDDSSEFFENKVEGFSVYVVDGTITRIEFTYYTSAKDGGERFDTVSNYVFEYSNIGETDVVKPNVSK